MICPACANQPYSSDPVRQVLGATTLVLVGLGIAYSTGYVVGRIRQYNKERRMEVLADV